MPAVVRAERLDLAPRRAWQVGAAPLWPAAAPGGTPCSAHRGARAAQVGRPQPRASQPAAVPPLPALSGPSCAACQAAARCALQRKTWPACPCMQRGVWACPACAGAVCGKQPLLACSLPKLALNV